VKLPLRRVIFWLHLAAGLLGGSVVLIMSVTGVLLMYERQITEWADRGYRSAPPPPDTARLPVETLVGNVLAARPGAEPTSVLAQSDPAAPVAVSLGRESTVYVNPYTGQVLGEGSQGARKVFRVATDWHRWLGAEGESRDRGKAITGASNLAFLFLVVSGFYLWVPRRWSRLQVRNVTWFRRGLPGKARDFNWHNVIGVWMAVPLFLVVISATVISYPWAGDLVYRLAGEEPPQRREGGRGGPGGRGVEPGRGGGEAEEAVTLDGLDELWAAAERQVPGWQTLSLRVPDSADGPVSFTLSRGHRGRPDLRAQLTLDRASREVVTWEPYASQSRGRRLRTWLRWLHTGEAGGFLGQTLAGLASAGAAVLVWTGFALAWRRFFPRGRRAGARIDLDPISSLEESL